MNCVITDMHAHNVVNVD